MSHMQLYFAADHAGFALKEKLKARLAKQGYEVIDLNPTFKKDDDYPLVAKKFVEFITRNAMGLLICGSGVGVCIAANRHKGIRAAVGYTSEEVKLAREHNDINVLCLSGWNDQDNAKTLKMIDVFLKTNKSAAPRHARRVKLLG